MKNVFLYVHSHWDREWYREFEEFRLRLIEVVDDVINKLQTQELPCFYFDGQTAALDDYLAIHPEKEEIIKKLIAQKKLFVGPFYCSADSFLVSAEFMIRNLCIGIEESQNFGCNKFIGYLSDTFGHSAHMPQILKSCGIEKAMLWRGLGNLPSEFNWNGIEATYLIQGYFQDIFSMKTDFDKKAELLEKFIDKIATRSSENVLLPCGADHLKVADNFENQVKEINKRLKKYKLKLSNPFEYLDSVKNNYKTDYKGEFLDQSKNFLLKGVYSSRIYQKQHNATCQWDLSRITEPAATICHSLGYSKNWQQEIDYAYKNTIKNHAHDSIYGCSTDAVHKDVERRFARTLQITNGIKKRLIRDLTGETDEISFVNLSNFDFNGCVEIETEKTLNEKYNAQLISTKKAFPDKKLFNPDEIPVTEDITTIKKYLIEVQNLKPFSISEGNIVSKTTHKITENSIENNFIALKIKYGKISLTDKATNKTYNNFIEITDRADIGDSYNLGPLKGDKPLKAKLTGSQILNQGKIKSTLRLTFEINVPKTSEIKTLSRSKLTAKHKIYVDVSISNLQNYLEFKLHWENKSKNHIMQVKFNLQNPVNKTWSEDLTGIVEREFDTDYNIYKFVPAPRGVELKTNTAPMQRFVWTQGIGLVTKGLNEYEIIKNSLNITLLRATGLISEPHNPSRGTPAGPPLECEDLQCIGENTAEFCLAFTATPRDLYKTAENFYGCVIPFFGTEKHNSFVQIQNNNVLVQALKLNSQNEVICRLVNVSDSTQKVKPALLQGFNKVFITDSTGENSKPAPTSIEIPANGLLTLKFAK